jgi:hypothetical protein
MKFDAVTIVCILIAIIILGVVSYKYFGKKEQSEEQKEYYGELLNELCRSGGCTTQELKDKAVNTCKSERSKRYAPYSLRNCESKDEMIRSMTCAEDCDISSVPKYLLEASNVGCKMPLETTVDAEGNTLCKNNMNMWIMKEKAKKQQAIDTVKQGVTLPIKSPMGDSNSEFDDPFDQEVLQWTLNPITDLNS